MTFCMDTFSANLGSSIRFDRIGRQRPDAVRLRPKRDSLAVQLIRNFRNAHPDAWRSACRNGANEARSSEQRAHTTEDLVGCTQQRRARPCAASVSREGADPLHCVSEEVRGETGPHGCAGASVPEKFCHDATAIRVYSTNNSAGTSIEREQWQNRRIGNQDRSIGKHQCRRHRQRSF